jgi:hypothetical protein
MLMIIGAAFLFMRLAEWAARGLGDARPVIIIAPLAAELFLAAVVAVVFSVYRESPTKRLQFRRALTLPVALGSGFSAAALALHGMKGAAGLSGYAGWIGKIEESFNFVNLAFVIALWLCLSRRRRS